MRSINRSLTGGARKLRPPRSIAIGCPIKRRAFTIYYAKCCALRKSTLVATLALAVFLVPACRPAAAPISVSNLPVSGRQVSKPLANMSWTTADDKVQKLADLNGKVVILDFWATYCGPCKQAIPHLNLLQAKYGAENLQIVGLNVGGAEDMAKIPTFVAETKIDYQIAFPDDDLRDFIFAETSSIPQAAVFDRKGRMVTKIVGFNAEIQKQLDEAVEQAVNPE